jgi:hypothetical protein
MDLDGFVCLCSACSLLFRSHDGSLLIGAMDDDEQTSMEH